MNVPNPDLDAVAAHAASAGDEPVVMVNLMKFKGAEHAQRFMAESRERTGPFVAALGATVLYTGLAGPEFCEDEDWDLVLIVQYPSFAAVERTLTDEGIGPFLATLRADTIADSRFILTTPPAQ